MGWSINIENQLHNRNILTSRNTEFHVFRKLPNIYIHNMTMRRPSRHQFVFVHITGIFTNSAVFDDISGLDIELYYLQLKSSIYEVTLIIFAAI